MSLLSDREDLIRHLPRNGVGVALQLPIVGLGLCKVESDLGVAHVTKSSVNDASIPIRVQFTNILRLAVDVQKQLQLVASLIAVPFDVIRWLYRIAVVVKVFRADVQRLMNVAHIMGKQYHGDGLRDRLFVLVWLLTI